jgi:hypothetical protein
VLEVFDHQFGGCVCILMAVWAEEAGSEVDADDARPCDSLSIRRRRETMLKTALCARVNSTAGGNGAPLLMF